MGVVKEFFGKAKDGTDVDMYTITNGNGVVAKFTNYGAILVSLFVPDKDGNMADVVLGYDDLEKYFVNGPNFGSTIGRHANRIGKASFVLNGQTYELDKNDGNNNLHGGYNGYHKRVWSANTYTEELGQVMEFTYQSSDGDQGFPGNLNITVKYILTEDNSIMIEYFATTDKDTVVNLTNHSYFNLAGHNSGTILEQKAWINAEQFTIADEESIPTGEFADVAGTPMDFRTPKAIGKDIDSDYYQVKWGLGFDHNWVLKTKEGEVSLVASLEDDKSGRKMEVYTDMAGIQFYTGNFLDGTEIGKGNTPYIKRSGVCFETQYFPNGINLKNFPQPVLKAGDEYHFTTIYKFLTK